MNPVAIGRMNWLSVVSVAAGSLAAVLISLVASCKLNEAETYAYLRDVLTKLDARPPCASLVDMLPNRWLAAQPSHCWAIASLRQQ
jgi:transposase